MQDGDVYETYADTASLARDFDFKVHTPLEVGLGAFVEWYDMYHSSND